MRTLAVLLLGALPLAAQAPPAPDPGFKAVTQIAIVCKDIEASAKRWAAMLGVAVPKINTTRPGSEVQVLYRGKPSDGRAKLAFFRLGQVSLELIEPVGAGTSWREGLDRHGESVHHIAFQVQDLEGSLRRLAAQDMPLVHRGRYDSDNGTYAYVDSERALGVVVELLHSDPKKN